MFVEVSKLKNGVHSCTARTRYIYPNGTKDVHAAVVRYYVLRFVDESFSHLFWQVFTDFQEIRQEIEAETDRSSGDNKVKRKALVTTQWCLKFIFSHHIHDFPFLFPPGNRHWAHISEDFLPQSPKSHSGWFTWNN